MKTAAKLALLVAGSALLAACSDSRAASGEPEVPGPDRPSTSTPTTEPPPEKNGPSTYPHDDYTFVVTRMCYCVDGGIPIEITVEDGEAVDARYIKRSYGHKPGELVRPRYMWITLDDVIALANTKKADDVMVRWPDGLDYPKSVYVDYSFNTADEELGYRVVRVEGPVEY